MSVPENRKGRARTRIIFTPWGGSGGGDADKRDNGGVPDKKGGGKIEGPIIEVPLPTPYHDRFFTIDSMTKMDIVCAPLILERLVPLPSDSRDESRGGAYDILASVMKTVHLVPHKDADGASDRGRSG